MDDACPDGYSRLYLASRLNLAYISRTSPLHLPPHLYLPQSELEKAFAVIELHRGNVMSLAEAAEAGALNLTVCFRAADTDGNGLYTLSPPPLLLTFTSPFHLR